MHFFGNEHPTNLGEGLSTWQSGLAAR
jgi:hypothetical protein